MNLGEEVSSGYRGARWWTLRSVDPDGVVRLLCKVLAGVPHLPGAACRGRYELFDEVARGGLGSAPRAPQRGGRAVPAVPGTVGVPAGAVVHSGLHFCRPVRMIQTISGDDPNDLQLSADCPQEVVNPWNAA